MQVAVVQENLAKGLGIVSRAISSRPANPILANVLLATEDGRLKLAATDLEIGITTRIGAQVESEGAITVPARQLSDYVNTLPPGRIDLDVDMATFTLTVKSGHSRIQIKGVDANEYPAIPIPEDGAGIPISAAILRDMIDHVVFAAAKEDNRPILQGVLTRFDGTKFAMVAADGYRMAMRTEALETAATKPLTLVIPAKTLAEVSKIAKAEDDTVYVSVPEGRNQVMFHMNNTDVVSQLIDGKFPDVEALIPKSSATVTRVDAEKFAAACKRALIVAREANYTTRFKIKTDGQMVITAQQIEKGDTEETLEVEVNGQNLEIAFNVSYLLEVLSVIDTEQVIIETNGPAAPGVIKAPENTGFIYIVMPMSVR
jgi:DNA polymerase-3 subunit beta